MGETLFIAHRIPFPPDRGDKIRSHHMLKALAKKGPVHVATFGETEADFAAEPLLAEVARTYFLARRPGLPIAGLRALVSGRAVSSQAFDSPVMRAWIARALAERPIDTVFVFSGQMGQYVPDDFTGRLIVDLCDVDSAKFEAYARGGRGTRTWIDGREGRLLAAEESRLVNRADATLLVSECEAELLCERLGAVQGNLTTVGNGIDTSFFDPNATTPHPDIAGERGPHAVFTGQMDYAPNVDAVRRAALQVMPRIRERYPHACFHVVGRAPVADVRKLEGLNGTRVWGEVADVRPFLAAADLVLAPLGIARGVQNKVLEAMAMSRPVVLTPAAATGIGGHSGVHYETGQDEGALARAACDLLANGERARAMGVAARRFTVSEKSWEAALAPLAFLLNSDKSALDAA